MNVTEFRIQKRTEKKSIYRMAAASGRLNTWVAAAEVTGLAHLLDAGEQLTVFAPTDDAFAGMPRNQIETLLRDFTSLVTTVGYHIAPGKMAIRELSDLQHVHTLFDGRLTVDVNEEVFVNNTRVLQPNIECGNGFIHTIECVLMVPERARSRAVRLTI